MGTTEGDQDRKGRLLGRCQDVRGIGPVNGVRGEGLRGVFGALLHWVSIISRRGWESSLQILKGRWLEATGRPPGAAGALRPQGTASDIERGLALKMVSYGVPFSSRIKTISDLVQTRIGTPQVPAP